MTPELMYLVLAGGGLLIGWLARHYGIPWAPPAPLDNPGLVLMKQLQDFLANQQQHLQTTDVLKQLVEKLPAARG
jgi:hypothetical protein